MFTPKVHDSIKKWLRKNLPEWAEFKVAPFAKLLGFFLGPQAGSKMWEGPMKKYNERILDIKRGHASIVSNSLTYNSRVAPVMSYVAQLVPLPKTFQERYGMLSILRCSNCMRHSDLFEIHKLGGPKLRSLEVSCTAALTRTALKTITHWLDWIKQLTFAHNEFLALDHLRAPGQQKLSQTKLCPDYWDSQPIVLNLRDAYEGFPFSKNWSEGGAFVNNKLLVLSKN